MANLIRWSKSDIIKLGKAVSTFNKNISKLEGAGMILPDFESYSDLRSSISTRQELNRVLTSLKSFSNPAMQKSVTLDSGLKITAWEQNELKKAVSRATSRLTGELEGIGGVNVGTGNLRSNEISSTLKMFDRIGKSKSYDQFNRRRKVIFAQGRTDYDMKKARIFQENFITAYTKMGRMEVVEIAKSFKNPMDFWNFIKDSGLTDIKLRYDVEAGIMSLPLDKDESYLYERQKIRVKLNELRNK